MTLHFKKRKRSYKRKFIGSTLGIVLFAWFIVGLFLYVNFAVRMREEQHRLNEEKVNVVAANMKAQYNTWMSIALKISYDEEFIRGVTAENPYYETELLKTLRKHELSSPLVENIFVVFGSTEDKSNIFSSKYGKSEFSTFCRHYDWNGDMDALYTRLQELKTVQIIPEEKFVMIVTPCYGKQRLGTIGFILPVGTLQEYIYLLIGEPGGMLSVCFRDVPVMGMSDTWQEQPPGIYKTDGGATRYISQKEGAFQVVLDTPKSLLYFSLQSFYDVSIVYMLSLCLLLAVIAAAIGYHNYRPIGFLLRKYQDKGISGSLNELSQLESLLDKTLENEEQAKQRIAEQYRMLRRQVLLLVLQGDEVHCALAEEGFLGIQLSGPRYVLLGFTAAKDWPEEKHRAMEGLVSTLSDEETECYFSDTRYPGKYCVLVSFQDESGLEGIRNRIRTLVENQGLQYRDASPVYGKLAKTPDMLVYTIVGAPKGQVTRVSGPSEQLFQNLRARQSLIANVRKGNEPEIRRIYAEYLADAWKPEPLEPLECCVHNQLVYDLCLTAQKDGISLQAGRLSALLGIRGMAELRSGLLTFLLELGQAYRELAEQQKEQEPPTPEHRHASGILLFIDENLDNSDLSLDMLADHLGLSTRYISSLIKEATGQSYKTYVTDKRMERAMELLLREKIPVMQVAQRVGYNNLSNFIRIFKRFTGETPGSFCERLQKEDP